MNFCSKLFGSIVNLHTFATETDFNNSKLEIINFLNTTIMTKKFKCLVCGYIHEGETAPEECPLCFVGPEDFVEVTEEEA